MAKKLTKEERRAAIKARAANLAGADPTSKVSDHYLKLPADIPLWKVEKAGMKIIDLVSFVAEHSNNHYGLDSTNKGYDEGDEIYARYYGVHEWNGKKYVCPRSEDKPCPFCDYQEKLKVNYEENRKAIKDLYPKYRGLYRILEDDKKFVWDSTITSGGSGSFEMKYRNDLQDDEKALDSQFLDDGKSIKLRFVDDTFVDPKGASHEFRKLDCIKDYVDRPDIDPKVADEHVNLNNVLEIKSYEELEQILNMGGETTTPKQQEEEEDYKAPEEPKIEESATPKQEEPTTELDEDNDDWDDEDTPF